MPSILIPKFNAEDVETLQSRYDKSYDQKLVDIVRPARDRQYLTKAELAILGDWKSPRIRSRLARNSEDEVRVVTQMALETSSVKLAVHIPQALVGVGMPVASTILHWFHKDPFPILDFRALWSLGFNTLPVYSLDFWEDYVACIRKLQVSWDFDIRTIDRALWQYSKENQPS